MDTTELTKGRMFARSIITIAGVLNRRMNREGKDRCRRRRKNQNFNP